MTEKYSIGIDPGWASCGYCMLDPEGDVMVSDNYVPRDAPTFQQAVGFITDSTVGILYDRHLVGIVDCHIERFVAYAGIATKETENILMFIGALKYAFLQEEATVDMVRAADWKPLMAKYLVRTKGFKNNSTSFDKKFSLQAAKALHPLLGNITDHEADAICLSHLDRIYEYNKISRVRVS